MTWSRRAFLKLMLVLGGAQLSGCLGNSSSEEPGTPPPSPQSTVSQETQPAVATAAPAQPAPAPVAPVQQGQNNGPVWDPAPTIQFVEGVPAVVPVQQFVRDPDSDALVIQLRSGALIPGITWNAVDGTIVYDGRALGARAEQPVLVSGVTFSADDRR